MSDEGMFWWRLWRKFTGSIVRLLRPDDRLVPDWQFEDARLHEGEACAFCGQPFAVDDAAGDG